MACKKRAYRCTAAALSAGVSTYGLIHSPVLLSPHFAIFFFMPPAAIDTLRFKRSSLQLFRK